MSNESLFTDKQEEKFYVCSEKASDEENEKSLLSFFTELVDRRRDDPYEGGLQACAVILPDRSAMKICEDDGIAPHSHTFVNLIKHLNNDHKYFTLKGNSNFMLTNPERKQLIEKGVEVRILNGKSEINFIINSNLAVLSEYQVEMVSKLISACKVLKDNKTYDTVQVGFHNPVCEIDFEDLSNEHYSNLLDGIKDLDKTSNKSM